MSVLVTTRSNGLPDHADEDTADHLAGAALPVANGRLVRLQVAPAAPEQRILAAEFRSPDGRCWNAIGSGATVAAAIIYAHGSCPNDAIWNDLFGAVETDKEAGPPQRASDSRDAMIRTEAGQ